MNLQLINNQPTMSSRDIANLTGKRHKNVMQDIRKMLEELKLDGLSFQLIYLDNKNRKQTEYKLPKRLILNLCMGYSAIMRDNILTHIEKLEDEINHLKYGHGVAAAMIEYQAQVIKYKWDASLKGKSLADCKPVKKSLIKWGDELNAWLQPSLFDSVDDEFIGERNELTIDK